MLSGRPHISGRLPTQRYLIDLRGMHGLVILFKKFIEKFYKTPEFGVII